MPNINGFASHKKICDQILFGGIIKCDDTSLSNIKLYYQPETIITITVF
jgi:hypothetical protein